MGVAYCRVAVEGVVNDRSGSGIVGGGSGGDCTCWPLPAPLSLL